MNIPSGKVVALVGLSTLAACSESTRKLAFDVLESPNGTFASTFMENASQPMPNEGEYGDEVCGVTIVENLPDGTQAIIQRDIGGDPETVRECTQPDNPMHDLDIEQEDTVIPVS